MPLPASSRSAHEAAPQNDLTTDFFDRDATRIDFSGPPHRFLYFAFDLHGCHTGLYHDEIGDASHATNATDRGFCNVPLVFPFCFTVENNPAAFHSDPNIPMKTAARS
jgi:hypothetical protein